MFSTQFNRGFIPNYQSPYVYGTGMLCSYTQGYLGVHPNALVGWDAPAPGFEVGPWAWQWSERILPQQGPAVHHSYTASIPQPQVRPTYGVGQAPPTFSRVVGGPAPNAKRPEIICPRPIHPLPKWIDMTEWEDDEDEPTNEEDEERSDPEELDADVDWEGGRCFEEEDYDVPRRFLPSFLLSPDPEDLPAPFFPPSTRSLLPPLSLASLSPDADDLPQPHCDSDPYSPVSTVDSRSSVPGLDRTRSSRSDSFESIISPDPADLPPPDFEIYARFGVEGFKFPEPHDRHHVWLGFGEGRREVVIGEGGMGLGSGAERPRRWLDRTWDL